MSLVVDDLRLRAGGRLILGGVSAALPRGRVTVLLGPNGAGKSTLLGCAAALRTLDSGRVLLEGADVARLPPRERGRRIGYLPQSAEVHWDLPGAEVIALGRAAHRGPFAALSCADRLAIDMAVAATDTRAFLDRPVRRLSGGERARVLLARVLAGNPEWLLADEPLASLDPSHQIDILDRLRDVARAGAGVVLVLHDLSQAARVADEVLLLKEGRVLAHGPSAEVLTAPLLRAVYGVDVHIARAAGGEPLLVPLRRSEA